MIWLLMTFARRAVDGAAAFVAREHAAVLTSSWGSANHWDIKGVRYLLDYSTWGQALTCQPCPSAHFFNDTRLAFVRTSWTSPTATYVAVKGGDNHLQVRIEAVGSSFPFLHSPRRRPSIARRLAHVLA